MREIKPTILIGTSAQPGAFSDAIIEQMSQHCEHPIIFPLSNPDEKCEAQPENILKASQGRALVATGTAFPAVNYLHRSIDIAQCNNALIYPGIGLGILAVNASRLSKHMILVAAESLSEQSPTKHDPQAPLLPSLKDAPEVAKKIAVAVAQAAIAEGLAQKNQSANLVDLIEELFWKPQYLPFKKIK